IRYLTQNPGVPLDVFRGGNSFSWSPDSRTLYFTGGNGVRDYLVREAVSSGRIELVTDRVVSAASFTPDLSRAVFLKANADRPADVTLLEGASESRLTDLGASVAEYSAVQPKKVSWKSRDGLPIEGVLLLPFHYQPGRRVPLLVELHGGPTGVATDSFPVPRVYPSQVFLEKGFAILSPSFLGSINYVAVFRLKNVDSQGFGD